MTEIQLLLSDGQFPEGQHQIRVALDDYRAARQNHLTLDLDVEQLCPDCFHIAVALAQDMQAPRKCRFT